MTSLAVLAAVDQRGPSSIYIATDSRLSWPGPKIKTWDRGMKAFASSKYPDIFGLCGNALFGTLVLSQFVAALDAGSLASEVSAPQDRFDLLDRHVRLAQKGFPFFSDTTLVYCGRHDEGMDSRFFAGRLKLSSTGRVTRTLDAVPPQRSQLVLLAGSGGRAIADSWRRWQSGSTAGTSRGAFSAFVESISSGADPYSGGPPQLVGLYRIGAGRYFGTVAHGKRYLHGADAKDSDALHRVEWRNELFERVDPIRKRRIDGAAKHETAPGLE